MFTPFIDALQKLRLKTNLNLDALTGSWPAALFWYRNILRAHKITGIKKSDRWKAPTFHRP
ncbi:hypothetical protein KL86PLE_110039 [uncultured Pleomorphomonas sp.]|uniref:Uncharacterized protein n=1 Tax=uncultured Pleomorphomonas sp. TaxID=442121 RepID=A0A212L763_9HYPH|nr:hypothetical protein KL86PLE_110039 [uncultured Pleomorphomonas sp.]